MSNVKMRNFMSFIQKMFIFKMSFLSESLVRTFFKSASCWADFLPSWSRVWWRPVDWPRSGRSRRKVTGSSSSIRVSIRSSVTLSSIFSSDPSFFGDRHTSGTHPVYYKLASFINSEGFFNKDKSAFVHQGCSILNVKWKTKQICIAF